MFAESDNVAILAAAGSRKTQAIVDTARAVQGRVLVTTYTQENLGQIRTRLEESSGLVPPHIDLMGWFTFLISHGAKPYQASVLSEPLLLRGLNFDGEPFRYTKKAKARQFYTDRSGNLYRKHISDFVVAANKATNGAVVQRISEIYDCILIDELQDLVGWDLELLELLFEADVKVLLVGDPRQHTYATNNALKHKKFRGIGMMAWLDDHSDICATENRTVSYRCNQKICDFADALYPDLPRTTSSGVEATGHDGVHPVDRATVAEYVRRYDPVILRSQKNANTQGLSAINIGISKGSTFDRVLIFPTGPMKKYFKSRDLKDLPSPAALYVAVTRARHSVGIVV